MMWEWRVDQGSLVINFASRGHVYAKYLSVFAKEDPEAREGVGASSWDSVEIWWFELRNFLGGSRKFRSRNDNLGQTNLK
jgi:hypothetical protein